MQNTYCTEGYSFLFFCPIFFLVVLRLQNVSPSHKFAENEGKRSENIVGANISLYTVNWTKSFNIDYMHILWDKIYPIMPYQFQVFINNTSSNHPSSVVFKGLKN